MVNVTLEGTIYRPVKLAGCVVPLVLLAFTSRLQEDSIVPCPLIFILSAVPFRGLTLINRYPPFSLFSVDVRPIVEAAPFMLFPRAMIVTTPVTILFPSRSPPTT